MGINGRSRSQPALGGEAGPPRTAIKPVLSLRIPCRRPLTAFPNIDFRLGRVELTACGSSCRGLRGRMDARIAYDFGQQESARALRVASVTACHESRMTRPEPVRVGHALEPDTFMVSEVVPSPNFN